MKSFLFKILAMGLLSSPVFASSSCDQMVAYGYPASAIKDLIPLCRLAYFVNYNPTTKDPAYSAEYLLKENLSAKLPRINAFKADPDLDKGERAELIDYNKEYDRGHMTPFEDTRKNSAASLQSFYLSNVCPQNFHLNRGLWRSLEDRTRMWALNSSNGVYVITGPVFIKNPKMIGPNKIYVPDSFYKIVIDKSTNQGIGFIIPNVTPDKTVLLKTYAVTIKSVEQVTGINFTPTYLDTSGTLKNTIGKEFLQSLK